MFNSMTTAPTYNAEQAKLDHPTTWIYHGEAVKLCKSFGVSAYKWREIAPTIPRNPKISGWTLYSRDALIEILQG